MDAHWLEDPRPRHATIRRKPLPHSSSNVSTREPLLSAESEVEVNRGDSVPIAPLYSPAVDSYFSTTDSDTDRSTLKDDEGDGHITSNSPAASATRNPFWVRRSTLALFMVTFAAMIACILSLYFLDRSQNGFRPILGSNQFMWSYTPTAVLVVIVSFWRQVDYQCKILQPWWELHKGPVSADRSLMLDYLSPIHPTSLVKAIKYRHFPVVASISGFVILKAVVLVSTGLLIITPTQLTGDLPITLTTTFNGSELWSTVEALSFQLIDQSPFVGPPKLYQNVSSSSVQTYYGTLKGNITAPREIVDSTLVQSFESSTGWNATAVSAEVAVFVPRISCEIAQPTLWGEDRNWPNVALVSETCSVGSEHQDEIVLNFLGPTNCRVETCSTPLPVYSMQRIKCSNVDRAPDEIWKDLRYALVTGAATSKFENIDGSMLPPRRPLRHRQLQGSNYTITATHEVTAAVICEVDYDLERRIVNHDIESGRYEVGDLVHSNKLDDLPGALLGELIYAALSEAENVDQDLPLANRGAIGVLYSLLLESLEGEPSLGRLMSPEILQQAATVTLSGLAAHFMRQSFLVPSRSPGNATGAYTSQRLHVGVTSMSIMVVGFILLIFCATCIILTAPRIRIPRLPDSAATRAMVLRSSTTLQRALRYTSDNRTSRLNVLLSGFRFEVSKDSRFEVMASRKQDETTSQAPTKLHSWIPFAITYPMIGLTFAAPLVIIVAIELLYRNSSANRGFIDVSAKEHTATLLSRYGTALIMLLIATCFNGFDFVVASFAPFSHLRRGAATAERSIKFHTLGSIPIVAMVKSLKACHFALTLSTTSAIIGSVLTIVTSGLLSVDQAVFLDLPVVANATSRWEIQWHNASLVPDNKAAFTLDHVQHGMAEMPSNILNDVVIPGFGKIAPYGWEGDSWSRNYTMQLTALRPELSCELVANEDIRVLRMASGRWATNDSIAQYRVHATPQTPPGCQRVEQSWAPNYVNFSQRFGPDDIWIGGFLEINIGRWPEPPEAESGVLKGTPQPGVYENPPDIPPGCPSIGVVFGRTSGNKTSSEDITALVCWQKIQQLSTNVTYTGNAPSNLVSVDLKSIPTKYLTNGSDGIDSFPWRVGAEENTITPLGSLTSFRGENTGPLDAFFDNLVYGPNGTALENLYGPSNRENLTMAVQRLYNKYMSLAIDMKFRHTLSSEELAAGQNNTVYGTIHVQTSRLKVNLVPKLVLQIMLGIMVLSGLGAFWLTDLRGTLPRNPCPIASTMSFFAGSDLCDGPAPLIPEDAVTMSKEAQNELFSGWLFSLGWWPDNKTPRYEENIAEALLPSKERSNNRFGIDVGAPLQLGFRETKWWKLRKRVSSG